MKKTLAILALLSGCVAASYGQGTVIFATTASAVTKVSVNSVVGGPATGLTAASAGSPTYYYALFYSTTGSTTIGGSSSAVVGANGTYAFNAPSWTFVASGTNGAAGKFNALGNGVNSDGSTTIPTIAAAATAQLVAIGWSANIGSTYAALQAYLADPTFAAWVGQSAVAAITLGNAPGTSGSQTPVSIFGTGAGQVTGLLLGEVAPAAVPEPGTMALAGLGGLSLLAFRRKK